MMLRLTCSGIARATSAIESATSGQTKGNDAMLRNPTKKMIAAPQRPAVMPTAANEQLIRCVLGMPITPPFRPSDFVVSHANRRPERDASREAATSAAADIVR